MHHVRVALDLHHVGEPDRVAIIGRDAADVVAAPRSTSIMCSARSFGSANNSSASGSVFQLVDAPARVSPGERIVTKPSSTRTRISGSIADQGEITVRKIEQEWARIHHPQDTVDIQRPGLRLDREPLAGNYLKDVAGLDVLLAMPNNRFILRA